MKKLIFLPKCFFLLALLACSDDDPETAPFPYTWIPSSISPSDNFYAQLMQSKDDALLALARRGWQNGIYKYTASQWDLHKEIPIGLTISSDHFAIVNDVVYYTKQNALYEITDPLSANIILPGLSESPIFNIYEFQGKLIILGFNIEISGSRYSIVTYDGTTLTGLSSQAVSGNVLEVNGKLFIPGYPARTYDGEVISPIDFFGEFIAIDDEESVYFSETTDTTTTVFKQPKKGGKIAVGEQTPKPFLFHSLGFIDNTIVGVGDSNTNGLSFTYVLRGNTWTEIPTIANLSNVTIYKNKLFATSNGAIVELAKN